MEAVPRMPMLAFELKNSSEHVDLIQILKTYIEDFYNENPENYSKECDEIDKLRQTVVNIPRDFTGCSTLKKYYAQLQFLQSRFPMEEDGVLAVPFTWECVFTGRPAAVTDIKFEQACILYNIGALHSILGALDSRQSPEGMKISCTHFQCASWAFHHLRDTYQSTMSPDFNSELLSFQASMLLAQAQECILEKSMTDNRKNIITAKIASQIVEYYRQAIKSLESKDTASVAGSRRVKEWKKRMELKMAYHTAVMYLYLGTESQEKEKHGEAVAYLQASIDKLNEALKLAKTEENEDIEASLTFAMDVIGGKFNSVKKDNDFVYHEKVPELDSLPELKGASLVKGIPFNPNDTEISGPDIFQRLVPMEAHEASSLYSEEKAQLLRTVVSRVEEKGAELEHYLASLQLTPDQIFPDAPTKLPQDLLEKCAAISVKPEAIKDLINAMQSLSSVATDTEVNIQEIFRLLEEEAKSEKQFQDSFGKRGHIVTLDEIHKECSKYKEGLATASKSNQDLHSLMNTNISNLKLLSGPLDELQGSLPSPEQHKTPEDDAVIEEMKKLMGKVDEMKIQRNDFLDKLRKEVHSDDVTSALVTRDGGSQEEFFKDQLKKHDKQIDLIDRNLTAQGNILKALTEANARYAKIRKIIKDCEQRREMTIEGLKTSFDAYEDLLSKTQKGIEFYKKLENSVNTLLDRTSRICKTQSEEREQITARLKPKVPAPSRPVAPKPGQATPASTTPLPPISKNIPRSNPLSPDVDPDLLAAMMDDPAFADMDPSAMKRFINAPQQLPPIKSEAPKLKDYLPFMKPRSFGANQSPQVPQASAPGDPSQMAGYPYPQGSEIPGVPTSQAQSAQAPRPPATVASQSPQALRQPTGHPNVPFTNYPGQHPSADQEIGELRLDGGRIPTSAESEMNVPSPSMSVPHPPTVPAQAHIPPQPAGQGPRMPATYGQVPGELPIQSPTAPPGAPSVKSHQAPTSQTSQPPGGPQAYYNYPQPPTTHRQPFVQPSSATPQPSQQPQTGIVSSVNQQYSQNQVVYSQSGYAPQGQGIMTSQSANISQGQGLAVSQSGGVAVQSQGQGQIDQRHGYTDVQYGAMGQPVYRSGGQLATAVPRSSVQQVAPSPSAISSQASTISAQPNMPLPQNQANQFPNQMHTPNISQPNVQNFPRSVPSVPQSQIAGFHANMQMPYQPMPEQSAVQPSQQQPVTWAQPGQQYSLSTVQPAQQQPTPNVQPGYAGQPSQYAGQSAPRPSLQSTKQKNQPIPSQYQQPGGLQNLQQGQYQPQGQPAGYPAANNERQPHPSTSQAPGNVYGGNQAGVIQQAHIQQPHLYPQQQPQQPQTLPQQPQTLPQQPQFWQQQTLPQQQQQTLPRQQQTLPQQPQAQSWQHQTFPQQQQTLPKQQQTLPQQQQALHQQPQMLPTQQTQPIQQQRFSQPQSSPQHTVAQQPQSLPQQQHMLPHQQHTSQQQQQRFSHPQTSQQHTPQPPHSQSLPRQQQMLPGQQQTFYQQPHPAAPQQQNFPVQQSLSQQPQKFSQQQSLPQHPGMQSQQTNPKQTFSPQQITQQQHPNVSAQQPRLPQNQHNLPQQPQVFPQQRVPAPQQTQIYAPVNQNVPTSQYYNQATVQNPGIVAPHSVGQNVNHGQYPANPKPVMGYPPQGNVQQTQHPSQQMGQVQGQFQPPGQNYSYQQQQHPLKQVPANSAASVKPVPTGNQSNLGALGQELLNEIKEVGPQPAMMHQGILQPSPIGSPQVLSPASTPNQTPRPTPSATPQPAPPNSAVQMPTQQVQSVNMEIPPGSPSHQVINQPPGSHQPPSEQPKTTLNQAVYNLNRTLPVSRQGSGASTASLDDILSSSPSNNQEQAAVKNNVLTPYRVSPEELQRQKEEQMKTSMTQKCKDPYTDDDSLGQFVGEVEVFAKHVDSLTKQTLSGPTPLDKEWRELSDHQDKEARNFSMAIARCYQMKNRFPDVMPYDATRVLLTGGSDDYVNASHIGDLSPTCPKMIAGQSPLPCTFMDFWQMVYEQGTEIIVMLNSDSEPGMQKSHIYWPEEKNRPIHHGPFQLNLQSSRKKNYWHERIITMTHKETRHARSVVHLQFIGWPPGGHPESPTMLLQFVVEIHSFYVQQRSLIKPVIIHCSDGIGRTGSFCVIYTMVQEIDHGKGIQNICDIVNKLRLRRKWMVREKEHLKFCYDAVLYYAQDLLMKRGILTNKASFNDKLGSKAPHIHTPTEDFIFGSPMPLSAIQSSVARMTLKERQAPDGGEQILASSTTSLSIPTHSEHSHSSNHSAPGSPQKVVTSNEQPTNQSVLPSTQNMAMSSNSVLNGNLNVQNPQQQVNGNSLQPQQQQNTGANNHQAGSLQNNVPQSLTDLQNPQTFNIGSSTPPTKKKITKSSFDNKESGIRDPGGNGDDPLNTLDPLWTVKK